MQVNKTQEVLALDVRLDRTYTSVLKRGESSPTLKTLLLLAHSLEIPLSKIIIKFEDGLQMSIPI